MDYTDNSELRTLLADSLCEKQGSYIIEELFSRFPVTNELMDVTEQELIQIKGIGKGKARQIIALLKLAKSFVVPSNNNTVIRSPSDVFELIEPDVRYLQKEHFICLFLNTKNHLIFKEVISIGSLNSAIVHPREVFRAAIKRCSASIIAVHNHPSGDPQPSSEDIEMTKRLVEAGSIIGIELLDHLIIGGHRFYSLKENSLM
ncbi:DNA repair protein RadC [Paenibacillus anaericanus]|uniref:DNA repair protein RadC n=1 Tax=Paenibacillus anaericanus TaxID=170367 RepID=A0A433XX76_9BACL|nr:DNA repair protein RadC [Paenibacillus anaericanus]RUT39401.1 DNA repair protein RadC [Paenibacillus anaericanus]